MTLPRRHSDKATLSSASPHINEILQKNVKEYQTFADEIVKRLQRDVPAPLLNSLVETAIYRLGRISADYNETIQGVALEDQQQPEEEAQQQPATMQPDRQRLKQWFLDHMSRPYPTNEEKEALAKESHMTVRQVSNWFINVRQRIWTPLARKYGIELPEQNLFVKSRVVLPEDAVKEILDAMK